MTAETKTVERSVALIQTPPDSPYPPSPAITLEWVGPETRREDLDGDDWPVTWAADDHQYTAYGDGWGARPIVKETKANTGIVRLIGPASDFRGEEVTIPWFGRGPENPNFKGCGLLASDGVLYHFLRYQGDVNPATGKRPQIASKLIWSRDYGQTWENATEYVPGERPVGLFFGAPDNAFHSPTFLQAGKDYRQAQDSYVYVYSPHENRRRANGSLDLARVPVGDVVEGGAYEYFAGLEGSGGARWTRDIAQRRPVFAYAAHVNAGDVIYNPALRRYLLVTCSGDFAPGEREEIPSKLAFFDAPQPWGPWTLAGYAGQWGSGQGGDLRYDPRVPAKWLSEDGFTAELLFSNRTQSDKLNHQTVRFRLV
ncbi:MAG TPA: DUF4185 domain-containing protein [Chloroflexota bacterium]|nr:DUF4185 domain-containing protein [Chloroflexota bacterium]